MTFIGYVLAFLATIGTYASFYAAGFGAGAILPAILIAGLVLVPFALRQT